MLFFLAPYGLALATAGFFFRARPNIVVKTAGALIIIFGLMTFAVASLTILGVPLPATTAYQVGGRFRNEGIGLILVDVIFTSFVVRKIHQLTHRSSEQSIN